ncbi:MAG: efflux RND transporter periplasmic adaptor subunit [Deltaproteobacteria bacterium]|nr:efflux RND transporter periplasmic adaptor subunit [Deltaproteobacteria bacterium]
MSENEKPADPEVHGHHDEVMPEGKEAPPPGVRTMAIIRWILVVLMAAIAAASLARHFGWLDKIVSSQARAEYYCPMHPGIVQDTPGDCPICGMTLVPLPEGGAKEGDHSNHAAAAAHAHAPQPGMPTTGEYYCPMHTEVTSTDPNATCPKCGGMKLVPKPAASPATKPGNPEASSQVPGLVPIMLSPERIQLMGMRTATVVRETLEPTIRTVGTVAASEKGLAVVQARFAGWIEELHVSQTGERVSKGQVLATIYSPEILTAQQEFLHAVRWSTGAEKGNPVAKPGEIFPIDERLKEDARRRLELLGISGQEIDAIERTGKPMRAIQIRSPVNGYVIEKSALKGLYIQPGMALFQVADLSTVWVLADVYEYEIGRIRPGQEAVIEMSAYPGEQFKGKVTFIYPSLDTKTRTLRVRMEFKNPGLRLKPGMFGNAYLTIERAEGLVIPTEAVADTGEMQYVFVAKPGGTFEPRKVQLGPRWGGKVQVQSGVSEGEVVVTTANFLLDSESRLRATFEGAAGIVPAGPCETDFDKAKYPEKVEQCKACAVHRGMGTMEEDCIKAIPKPWK